MTTPQLQPPGAGLPPLEQFLARYILFPIAAHRLNEKRAQVVFQQEGERIVTYATSLSTLRLNQPVLIRRFPGIEDSSRHWSVAMTIEHLLITGNVFMAMISALRQGHSFGRVVNTANVKPTGKNLEDVIPRFKTLLTTFATVAPHPFEASELEQRHLHPWFGALNAKQWHSLAAMHQGIHRRQIEFIIRDLA